MKKVLKVVLTVALMLGATSIYAQKFGRINSQEIIMSMPETEEMRTNLETFGKELEENIETINVEFNNKFRKEFEDAGMRMAGINPDSDLVEIITLPDKKWFVGTQFHPEYSSTVENPHPLFLSFVSAAVNK